jgi:RNA polymerase sigma factor (TIGR02999 family)
MSNVTLLLESASAGNAQAASELLPLVYDELRRLAAARMAKEKVGHTLQPTALVHEAFLRLVGQEDTPRWANRAHFFTAAAQAMRRILVESARRKLGPQRGGDLTRQELDFDVPAEFGRPDQLLLLDQALEELAATEPRAAEVVKLRFFAGLSIPEVALALNISPRTVDTDWAYARAWLISALEDN